MPSSAMASPAWLIQPLRTSAAHSTVCATCIQRISVRSAGAWRARPRALSMASPPTRRAGDTRESCRRLMSHTRSITAHQHISLWRCFHATWGLEV